MNTHAMSSASHSLVMTCHHVASKRVEEASLYMTRFFAGLQNSYNNLGIELTRLQKENNLLRTQRMKDLQTINQLQNKIISLQEDEGGENDGNETARVVPAPASKKRKA